MLPFFSLFVLSRTTMTSLPQSQRYFGDTSLGSIVNSTLPLPKKDISLDSFLHKTQDQ